MFSHKEWVDFPWTQAQIAQQQISRTVVSN
jgi:hypothetical protein